MGKRLCLTFSVYYFVHPYNITALMICQHVFLNIYIFYRKIVTENRMNSNVKSDSDLIATNRSVAKAVLAIHVIIAELANKKLRPTKGTE